MINKQCYLRDAPGVTFDCPQWFLDSVWHDLISGVIFVIGLIVILLFIWWARTSGME